ncbi:MAG: hypothetical protein QXX08_04725 [Candidatus Bathyarchaeia archaeon]
MRKSHIGLILLAVTLASVIPIAAVNAQSEPQSRVDNFIELVKIVQGKIVELKSYVEEGGITIPDEINNIITEADNKLAEADTTMDIELAKEAMRLYREAFRLLHNLLTEDEEEIIFGLRVAIERAYREIDRLQDIVDHIGQIESNPPDVEEYLSWIEGNLTQANANLTEAVNALDLSTPDIEDAANNLTEAKKNIADAFKALRLIAKWTICWRFENFVRNMERFRERIRARLWFAHRNGVNVGALLEGLGFTDKDGDQDVDIDDYKLTIEQLVNTTKAKPLTEAVEDFKDIRQMIMNVHQALMHQKKGY